MPNPVAVNDLSPISGSLQTSRISYAVETAGKNYGQAYNGTTWYSDIPQNGSQYTIISDNYTANYYVSRSNAEGAYVEGGLPAVDEYSAPVFWLTAGTSSLDIITIVNGLPDRRGQIPFNSGSQALNWIASSSNYFAVGPDYYEQIDADQLRLYLDANQIISYPTTQSTWYDLSGYTNNATLYNGLGTSWSSSGWFNFDGTDDYANAGNSSNFDTNTFSVEALVRLGAADNSMRTIASRGGNPGSATNGWWLGTLRNGLGSGINEFRVMYWGTSTYLDLIASIGANNLRWHHVVATSNGTTGFFYIDGVLNTSATLPAGNLYSAGDNFLLGVDDSNGSQWTGSINEEKFYSKALSASDVAQNYYGGPIVTNGLVYALDAGNLVSYPKSGTTWYTLTGSVDGTLTNGPTFSSLNDGYINFDGTNDYVGFGNNILFPGVSLNGTISELTIDVWVNWNQFCVGGALDEIISWWASGTQTYSDGFLGTSIISPYSPTNPGIRFGDDWVGTGVTFTAATDVNKWWNIMAVKSSNNAYIYINGELRATKGSALDWGFNNYAYVAAHGGGASEFLDGKIASLRLYNRALTAAEVLQNYNATK
jgi:hypothetical protein